MKQLFFVFALASILGLSPEPAMAQSKTPQIFYAIVGGFEYLFERLFFVKSSPDRNLVIDYNDTETINKLSLYNRNTDLRIPNQDSTFRFTNTHDGFGDVSDTSFGACRGYSSLRRKFRMLSHFDGTNSSGMKVPDIKHKKKYVRFYRRLIRDIRNYKFRVIPGYASLYAMSSDPVLSKMIKKQVLLEWKDRNFSPGMGTNDLLKGTIKKTSYEDLLKMRYRIEQNALLGHNTIVWLSQEKSTWIHALEATTASEIQADGSFRITFWNDKFVEPERAHSELLVTKEGRLLYYDSIAERELNAAGVTDENDGEMVFMAGKLKEFCTTNAEKCEMK